MRTLVAVGFALAMLVSGCGSGDEGSPPPEPTSTPSTAAPEAVDTDPWPAPLEDEHQLWTVRVVDRLPHDPAAFTQGLEFTDFGLLEGTGRRGESTLRSVSPNTGAWSIQHELDDDYFGEGITQSGDEIIQLTWQAGIALRYDARTLEPLATSSYEGEGWGICSGLTGLWMSNGTAELTRRDAVTFSPLETVTVRRDGSSIDNLNELECIGDHVVANVWKSNEILVIEPATGAVLATIDAGELSNEIGPTEEVAVLNGIADMGDGTLLLGGKLWPTFFVVEVVTG